MSFLPGHLRAAFAQARRANDYYVEPVSCVHQLFDAVGFCGMIHDPCCGQGTIPNVARIRGYETTGADIVCRDSRYPMQDFLTDPTLYDNIVSNPPYGAAEAMWRHAATHVKYKVAFVLRISFLAGQRRRDTLFNIYPPSEVVILSQRPSMPPGGTDIPAKGGTADYAWFVRDRYYAGPTILRWV